MSSSVTFLLLTSPQLVAEYAGQSAHKVASARVLQIHWRGLEWLIAWNMWHKCLCEKLVRHMLSPTPKKQDSGRFPSKHTHNETPSDGQIHVCMAQPFNICPFDWMHHIGTDNQKRLTKPIAPYEPPWTLDSWSWLQSFTYGADSAEPSAILRLDHNCQPCHDSRWRQKTPT